jgi:predicted AAA+ superfamily ATPase
MYHWRIRIIAILPERDPNGFLARYDSRVIIDEVQRVPELFSYLQTKVDADGQMGQYILSGSQNFHLLDRLTQKSAAGCHFQAVTT